MDPLMSAEEIRRIARQIDAVIVEPIMRLVPDVGLFLISPDGMLDLLPFEALVDGKQQYLIENTAFNYLTSGRDLLDTASLVSPRSAPIFADHIFDDDGTLADHPQNECPLQRQTESPHTSTDFHALREWNLTSNRFDSKDIASTLREVSEIAKYFPGSTLLTGSSATEAAVKNAAGPTILHLATHGFFIRNQVDEKDRKLLDDETVATFNVAVEDPPRAANSGETTALSPLVRSGLALSGANALKSVNNNDGILTALEVSTLDL